MKTKTRYILRGAVKGNLWGGGQGWYPANSVVNSTLEEVKSEARARLDDDSLDSGMGFESLASAIFTITKETTKIINKKEYINNENIGGIAIGEKVPEAEFNNIYYNIIPSYNYDRKI